VASQKEDFCSGHLGGAGGAAETVRAHLAERALIGPRIDRASAGMLSSSTGEDGDPTAGRRERERGTVESPRPRPMRGRAPRGRPASAHGTAPEPMRRGRPPVRGGAASASVEARVKGAEAVGRDAR